MPSLGWSTDRSPIGISETRLRWQHKASSLVSFWPLSWPKTVPITTQKAQSKGKFLEGATCSRGSGTSTLQKSAPLEPHPTYTFVGVNLADREQQYIHARARARAPIGYLCRSPSAGRLNDDLESRFPPQLWFPLLISESLDRQWQQEAGKAPQTRSFGSPSNHRQSGVAINLWSSAPWVAAADDEESCALETRSRYTGVQIRQKLNLWPVPRICFRRWFNFKNIPSNRFKCRTSPLWQCQEFWGLCNAKHKPRRAAGLKLHRMNDPSDDYVGPPRVTVWLDVVVQEMTWKWT